jgi:hypothetical protein
MKNFDRIEEYLKNEMDAEARSQFEKELKSNAELRVEFEIQKLEYETLDQLGEEFLLNEIKNIRAEEHNQGHGLKLWRNVKMLIPLAVAASIAVFFGIRWLNPSEDFSYPSLAVEYYDSYSPNFSQSRIMEEEQSEWMSFMTALEKDQKETLRNFINQTSFDLDKYEVSQQFYIAHAFFKLEEYSEASKIFSVLSQETNLDRQEMDMSEFYLALSYMLDDRLEDSQGLLNKISSQEGHSFQGIASEMLAKMP